jgi:hypothetical protein
MDIAGGILFVYFGLNTAYLSKLILIYKRINFPCKQVSDVKKRRKKKNNRSGFSFLRVKP